MLIVSVQEFSEPTGTRTLLALREPNIVRAVVKLIAERLPELTEDPEPPNWLRFVEEVEGDGDDSTE